MILFDLLAADFRSALAGCGMDHDQETIKRGSARLRQLDQRGGEGVAGHAGVDELLRENDGRPHGGVRQLRHADRKSTPLNSSHLGISYAVFCLKKKKDDTYKQKTRLH